MSQATGKPQPPLVQQWAHLPFRTASHDETAAQLGLITLETDLTIETELRHFIGDSIGTKVGHGQKPTILHSRIACDDKVTSENLTAMSDRFGEITSPVSPRLSFRCGRVWLYLGIPTDWRENRARHHKILY